MERTPSGGHTGDASGVVHQGPRPLGAHQRGPDSNFFEKLTLSTQQNPVPMTSFIKAQHHLLQRTLMTSLIASRHSCCHSVHCLRTI